PDVAPVRGLFLVLVDERVGEQLLRIDQGRQDVVAEVVGGGAAARGPGCRAGHRPRAPARAFRSRRRTRPCWPGPARAGPGPGWGFSASPGTPGSAPFLPGHEHRTTTPRTARPLQ